MSSGRFVASAKCPPGPPYRRSLLHLPSSLVHFCLFLFLLFYPVRVVDVQEEHWTEEVEANERAAVSGR